jgi:predicted ester cyclase
METSQHRFVSSILSAVLIIFAIGCHDQAEKAGLDRFRAAAQIQEQNRGIVRELFVAIDSGNFDKLDSLLSDDFSLHLPGVPQPWKRDALFQARNKHYASFPDWIHKIEDLVAEGDKVAVKLIQYGTHRAQYKGIEPTGNYVSNPAIHVMRIANGKVKEWWALEDNLGLMRQLGMELKPKENKK